MTTFVVLVVIIILLVVWTKRRKKKKKVKETDGGIAYRKKRSREIDEGTMRDKPWSMMVDNAAGHGKAFMESVAVRIRDGGIPDTTVSSDEYTVEGADKPRTFVVVGSTAPMTRAYKVLIGAEDYGTRLNISSYVLFDFSELDNGAKSGKSLAEGEALQHYTSMVRHLLNEEIKELTNSLNIDFTKVSSATRGFENLS